MATVEFDDGVYQKFVATVAALYPRKCYGYLLSSPGTALVTDFYVFDGDLRSTEPGRQMFESEGRYYFDHSDAGFLAPPEETIRFEQARLAQGLTTRGMFHVHLRHPPYLAEIDRRLHADPRLWHLIVSLRTPSMPDLMVYVPDAEGRLQPGQIAATASPRGASAISPSWDEFVAEAMASGTAPEIGKLVTAAAEQGIPVPSVLTRAAMSRGERIGEAAIARGAEIRLDRVRHRQLWWATTPVTVAQYLSVMAGIQVDEPAARLPMTQVDVHDAELFARLVGGRLPAIEEFRACVAAGSPVESGDPSSNLAQVAVFSENAPRLPPPVATRSPDAHGIYDLQGLVWEWVTTGTGWATVGGSRFAFAEMCDPGLTISTLGSYKAQDIGFRVCWDV